MKSLSLVALLLLPSLARAADDAPLLDPPVSVPATQRINEGKAMAACLAKNDSYEKGNVIVSTPVFIAIIAGVVAASVAATVGISKATQPKP